MSPRCLGRFGSGFCGLVFGVSVTCVAHASAAQLGPPRDIWDLKEQSGLFSAKVLACPAPHDVTLALWGFEEEGTWPMGDRDPNAEGLRVAAGELKFRMTARRVQLGWGSFGKKGGAALPETISFRGNQIAGAFIYIRLRQSQPGSRWSVEFCYRGDPNDTGFVPGRRKWGLAGLEASSNSTDWQTLTFPCCQLAAADGLGIRIEGKPDTEITIDSIRVVQHLWDTYARKTITIGDGPIFSARATVSVNTNVWVNGHLVHEDAVDTGTARYQLVAVDLKPHLRPGKNAICLSDFCRMKHTPIAWMQGAVQMVSGEMIPVETGPEWKTNVKPEPGWLRADFDDERWLPPGDKDPTGYLRGMQPHVNYHPGRVPAYCGQLELENPYAKKLYYDAAAPVRFRVRLPMAARQRDRSLKYEVRDDRTLALVAQGQTESAEEQDEVFVHDITVGELPRGVYTLLLDAGSGQNPQLRRQEVFIVTGKIPMPETDGRAWDADLDLTLVDEIDCTDPNDPHPFCDAAVFKPRYASRVVTRGELTYRESLPSPHNQYSWFSYKFRFRKKGRPHWIVIDYPDDAPRLIEAQVLPLYRRPKTTGRYASETAWASPGAQVGGAYPNTGKMQLLRMIVWSHEIDAAVILTNAGRGSAGCAASCIRVYEIEQLPALKVHRRGRRFGLFTERASVMERTYGGSPRLRTAGKNPYLTWLDEAERYAQYCRFTGQNAYFMGCYQYTYSNSPAVAPDTGAEGCSLVPSQRDVFINVLGANGIETFSGVEYRTDPRDWHKAWPALHQVVESGADFMFQVDKNGVCHGGHYQRDNPMASPAARRSVAKNIGHISDRFSVYRSWKGITLVLAPKWEGPVYDSADVSFDDQTIKLFQSETGTQVPIPFDDPARFRKRYELLVGKPRPDVAQAWFDWRSKKLAQVHDALAKLVKSKRPDADYMVIVEYPVDQVYGAARKPLRQMMRDIGYDPRAYADRKGYYFGRDVWSFTPLADGRAIGWEEWMHNPEVIDLMNGACGAGRAMFVRWGFDEWNTHALVNADPAVWPGGYWINYGTPGHRYLPERFTHGLVDSDIDTFLYGFCDSAATVGGEQEMRRFVREFTSLPRARFTRLTGNGLDRNIAIKAARVNGEYFVYVANPGWWECEVRVTLAGPDRAGVVRTVDGAPVQLQAEGANGSLRLPLPPFGLVGFTGPEAALKPLRTEVIVPEQAQAYISRRIAECTEDLAARGVLPEPHVDDLRYVNRQIRLAQQASERGDWAAGWRHTALAAYSQAGRRLGLAGK